jgi:hypothetical protein
MIYGRVMGFWIVFVLSGSCAVDTDPKVMCTSDAEQICRERSPGVYSPQTVGRNPPSCEFESFDDEVDLSYCSACFEERDDIKKMLSKAAVCEDDGDCQYVSLPASCEFGCGAFVNQLFSRDAVQAKVNGFLDQRCGDVCSVQCVEHQVKDQPKCRDQTCVLINQAD